MGIEQGHLQPDGEASAATRRKVQREEGSLYPGGPAPKRMRSTWVYGQGGRGKKREVRSRGRRGAGRRDQGNAKWSMPGFRVDPVGSRGCSDGWRQLHSEICAGTSVTARCCWQGDMAGC